VIEGKIGQRRVSIYSIQFYMVWARIVPIGWEGDRHGTLLIQFDRLLVGGVII
jgi:hypothetical protein